eukprot:1399137-Prymnesium_polylepis.1
MPTLITVAVTLYTVNVTVAWLLEFSHISGLRPLAAHADIAHIRVIGFRLLVSHSPLQGVMRIL